MACIEASTGMYKISVLNYSNTTYIIINTGYTILYYVVYSAIYYTLLLSANPTGTYAVLEDDFKNNFLS